jgi:hypothetical protein
VNSITQSTYTTAGGMRISHQQQRCDGQYELAQATFIGMNLCVGTLQASVGMCITLAACRILLGRGATILLGLV